MKNVALVAVFLLFPALDALAETSGSSADSGRAFFSALECTVLAAKIGRSEEQKRLFEFGYKEGKKFIDSVRSGEISEEDLSSKVPVGVLWHMQGPTTDFILGRIYESAAENVLEGVYGSANEVLSTEEQNRIAENKFSTKNCELIGQSANQ
ncbi:hypothetical protein [Saccharospirillum salsuginis]|uniref:Uncharacterized protein n=1 Tax=Saccharospirillum salsuginis TaxID=418750 RepID=A0A918N709_9GAMM|nr:hypothetical protein [Saccharospirillum salsuginis]GGX42588.1 hypothetical protein GCM10007392_06440 [Saccharospirillum salsuginis]